MDLTVDLDQRGDKLPPMRARAADLAVSRTTVATPYQRLTAEGYVE